MLVYYFVPFIVYSEFQTVLTPSPSKIGHMFIWTFLITKTYEIISCRNVHQSWNTLYQFTLSAEYVKIYTNDCNPFIMNEGKILTQILTEQTVKIVYLHIFKTRTTNILK